MVTGNRIQTLVVGGGIGGLTLAVALRAVGIEPVVIDADEHIDDTEFGVVELWPEALARLDELGVGERVRERGTTVDTWTRRVPDGTVTHRQETETVGFVSLPYAALRTQLAAAVPDGTIQLGRTLQSLDIEDSRVIATFANGVREPFDLVVGADGARSRTRTLLGGGKPRDAETWTYSFPLPSWSHPTETTEVWTADGDVFRVVPTGETAVGKLSVLRDEPTSDSETDEIERVLDNSSVEWVLQDTLEDIDPSQIRVRGDHQMPTDIWGERRTPLIGDAAHVRHRLASIGPMLAVEDAVVLAEELSQGDASLHARITDYATRRRARIDRLETSQFDPDLLNVDTPLSDRYPSVLTVRNAQIATHFGDESQARIDSS